MHRSSSIRPVATASSRKESAKAALLALYVAFLIASFFFTKASVGVPVRTLILFAGLVLVVAVFADETFQAMREVRSAFAFIIGIALLGLTVSVLNNVALEVAADYFSRFILQPLLVVAFLAATLIILGQSRFGLPIVFLVLVSIVVAAGQYLKLPGFWEMRSALSAFQDEAFAAAKQRLFVVQDRPMGLSLTTIHLSYQIVVAYIILKVVHHNGKLGKALQYGLILALAFGAFVSGNRSCLLAILVAEFAFAIATRDRTIFLATPLLVIGLVVLALIDSDNRTLTANDGSAMGRIPLYVLGLHLIADNPLGYGWGFDSRDYAYTYWDIIGAYDNSKNAELFGLHNFFLNFLTTYGLITLPLFLCWALTRAQRAAVWFILMLPYGINAALHNDGPFYGDNHFWYAFVLCFLTTTHWQFSVKSTPSRSPSSRASIAY